MNTGSEFSLCGAEILLMEFSISAIPVPFPGAGEENGRAGKQRRAGKNRLAGFSSAGGTSIAHGVCLRTLFLRRLLDCHNFSGLPRLGGGAANRRGFGPVIGADAGGLVLEHAVHELLDLNETGLLKPLREEARVLGAHAAAVTAGPDASPGRRRCGWCSRRPRSRSPHDSRKEPSGPHGSCPQRRFQACRRPRRSRHPRHP